MSHFYSHQQPVIPRKQSDKHGALTGGVLSILFYRNLANILNFLLFYHVHSLGGTQKFTVNLVGEKSLAWIPVRHTHVGSSALPLTQAMSSNILSSLGWFPQVPPHYAIHPPPSNNAYPAGYCEDENYVNSECNRFWNWLLLYNGSDYNYHIIRPGKRRVWDEYFNHYIYNRFSAFLNHHESDAIIKYRHSLHIWGCNYFL